MRKKQPVQEAKREKGQETPSEAGAMAEGSSPSASHASRETETLSEAELVALCESYRSGAQGDVLLGFAGKTRLLTLMLPGCRSEQAGVLQMERAVRQLRAMQCDGYLHARKVRLRDGKEVREMLLITECIAGAARQTIRSLMEACQEGTRSRQAVEDALSRCLREHFPAEETRRGGGEKDV